GCVQEYAVAVAAREMTPRLVCGKAQNGSKQAKQRVGNMVQSTLSRPSRQAVCACGVEPVLENIEVERTEIFGAKHMQLLRDQMELVATVVMQNRLLKLMRHSDRVTIEFHPLRHRDEILGRIKIGQVG